MAITKFSGIFNAFDYAYGINEAAPAFQVISGSNVSGTYTVVCSPAVPETVAGLPITITANTPITIGTGTNLETVTPSAVSTNNLGQVLITATFANAHGVGAPVRSGSLGLAEAVVAANAAGGGVVAVDARWTRAGGVNATITATKGFLNVTILDARGTASGSAFSFKPASNGAVYAATTVSWY